MSIKATPTPAKALLDPSNHALILIDYQSQMAFATKSIAPELLRNNAALIANGARVRVPHVGVDHDAAREHHACQSRRRQCRYLFHHRPHFCPSR